jgi:hypothetical protein
MNVPSSRKSPDLAERFQINYIKIDNKPARAFLFQLQESNMIFIWAEKINEGE